jgi:hypothetical protein
MMRMRRNYRVLVFFKKSGHGMTGDTSRTADDAMTVRGWGQGWDGNPHRNLPMAGGNAGSATSR